MKKYQIVLIFIPMLFLIIGLSEKAQASSSLGTMYYLRNSITGGSADQVITYGKTTDKVLVGDW
ncbi:hypothetical protein, partial [Lactobacillus amylolyticus]|uniref:hypothetical protein n=1 Tax=Lactobacillus amylolyticus TaxID=83683 RepID=UPI002490DDC7